MPRGRGKGGNKRKKGKNTGIDNKRELVFKMDDQEYAQVLKLMGGGRLEAHCFDGKRRLCTIRGKLKNRVWINNGDVILVSLREMGDDRCDVLLKYNAEEVKQLKELQELPEHVEVDDNPDFDFIDGSDEEGKEEDDFDIDDI